VWDPFDRLSNGRVTLGVGRAPASRWLAFERDQGRRTRAELVDEGLDVLFGLGAEPRSPAIIDPVTR
jgi:alkanesulfonate monooxygenase SsuD/methylene tetrahydromethanopterin reductase-like flavin-dependent oxidoreductase (luciferase family)